MKRAKKDDFRPPCYDLISNAVNNLSLSLLLDYKLAGNHKGGLSVGKAIASGYKAADLVISYLESSSDDMVLREES